MTAAVVAIVVAVIAAVPATISAVLAGLARHHAASVDDAVNHRHPDSPRLYDAVLELVAWRRTWDNLPPDLDSDADLCERFARIDAALDQNSLDHTRILDIINPQPEVDP